MTAYTPRTIKTLPQLRRELEQIRIQVFSVNRGEWRDSVRCLAAIVHDGIGRPIAANGISGPSQRLDSNVLRRYSEVVTDTARGLSRALGYNPIAFTPSQRRVGGLG